MPKCLNFYSTGDFRGTIRSSYRLSHAVNHNIWLGVIFRLRDGYMTGAIFRPPSERPNPNPNPNHNHNSLTRGWKIARRRSKYLCLGTEKYNLRSHKAAQKIQIKYNGIQLKHRY